LPLPPRVSLKDMWHSRVQQTSVAQGQASALVLEANAACAGLALACAYSSSEEFEAEIIKARLAANDEKHRQHRALCAVFAAAAAIFALLCLTA
jgi:hypothetical protein